jgi:Secretion system C-terminal sorting domain
LCPITVWRFFFRVRRGGLRIGKTDIDFCHDIFSLNLHHLSMKGKKNWIAMLLLSSVFLMSMTSDISHYDDDEDGKAGHNGSPGEQTCAKSNCHNTYTLNSGTGSVSISVAGMTNWQYVPGQTYNVSVTVAQNNVSLFGFGFEALLSSGANAGTLTAGVGSHALNSTVNANSRKTITHLLDAGTSANSHTFTFTWVAPTNGAAVTFYAAGNAANNNGGDSGDYIYTTSQALTAVVVPNAPTITAGGSVDLCNGSSVSLSVPSQTGVTFSWYNELDQLVGTGASLTVDDAGCYDVIASASGGNVNSTNNICVTTTTVDATFAGPESIYCSNQDVDVVLVPSTVGGTFSGNGVTGNVFNPTAAGVGNHVITYEVASPNGCSDSFTLNVFVNQSSDPSFTLEDNVICENDSPVALLPLNAGGDFSGVGVSNGTFDPSIGSGLYTIGYTVGIGNCAQSSFVQVEVLQSPDASFGGLNTEYCSNGTLNELLPEVAGGIFDGPGMSDNTFNPSLAGAGLHVIQYTLTDEFGCSASTAQTVEVNQSVSAVFIGLQEIYCVNAEPVTLIPSELGGVFSFNASNGEFLPSMGPGIYEISYTNGEGSCEVTTTQTTEVLPIDDASFTGLLQGYCINADSVQLVAVNDGVYSGNGLNADVFSPINASIGENIITHTVTAENGCVSVYSQSVLVYETANSDFSGLAESYCAANTEVELLPINQGGNFIGPGVTNNMFNPAAAGSGVHIITHVVDLVGCSSSSADTVTVFALPSISVTGLQQQYCIDDASAILFANQGNALFDGPGVIENMFSPSDAGEGVHEINCIYTDVNGCVAEWVGTTQVYGLPQNVVTLTETTLTAIASDATYQWVVCPDMIEIPNANSQSFTPSVNGEFAAVITQNGCDVMSDCVEVIVIGVDEVAGANHIAVFPNPACESVNIALDQPSSILVYNSAGQLVLEQKQLLPVHIFDVSNLENGIYSVVATTASERIQKIFIVRK